MIANNKNDNVEQSRLHIGYVSLINIFIMIAFI